MAAWAERAYTSRWARSSSTSTRRPRPAVGAIADPPTSMCSVPSFPPTFPSPLSCGSGRQAVRFRVRLRGADPHPRRLPGPRCRRDVVPVSAAISDQRRPPQKASATIEARRDDPDSQALFETYDAEADLWAGEGAPVPFLRPRYSPTPRVVPQAQAQGGRPFIPSLPNLPPPMVLRRLREAQSPAKGISGTSRSPDPVAVAEALAPSTVRQALLRPAA